MFDFLKRKTGPTASEIGRMGNAVRWERERLHVRARVDEMRAKLGMEPARWGPL